MHNLKREKKYPKTRLQIRIKDGKNSVLVFYLVQYSLKFETTRFVNFTPEIKNIRPNQTHT